MEATKITRSGMSHEYNYLFCDWKVQLLPAEVPDLAGLEAGNLSPHRHHRRVPAHVRNVRSAARKGRMRVWI